MKLNQYIKSIWKNYADKIVFVLFVLQITLFYKLIQLYVPAGQIFKINSIDNIIPLMPIFVIPYVLFIPILFLPFVMSLKDKKLFLAISASFLTASIICNIVYILFQTTIYRPEIPAVNIIQQVNTVHLLNR